MLHRYARITVQVGMQDDQSARIHSTYYLKYPYIDDCVGNEALDTLFWLKCKQRKMLQNSKYINPFSLAFFLHLRL